MYKKYRHRQAGKFLQKLSPCFQFQKCHILKFILATFARRERDFDGRRIFTTGRNQLFSLFITKTISRFRQFSSVIVLYCMAIFLSLTVFLTFIFMRHCAGKLMHDCFAFSTFYYFFSFSWIVNRFYFLRWVEFTWPGQGCKVS